MLCELVKFTHTLSRSVTKFGPSVTQFVPDATGVCILCVM
jgi:hypothetical protein